GVVIPDVDKEKNFSPADRPGGVEMRSLLVAPIQSQGRVIGVLEAINPISKSFDPDALLVMTGIGGLAGTTIQNAQLFERLQAAHQRYRELFEDSIDPMVITDWDGRILEANRQVSLISGYSNEELHELSIDQVHEVNWNKTGMEFEFLRNNQTHTYESSLHKQDETHIPIEIHARRVEFDEADSIQWIVRDITERKELDSLREDLTSMIYHDLRSPLANIVSSLDVIADMIPEAERETVLSILKIAENSTDRIQRLVSSLLDVSRLESGQTVADQTVVETLPLVRDVLENVEPSARGRKQTLVEELPDELPPIWVDEDMARRVLINLVENACKYSPSNSTIKVGAKEEDGWMHFWIEDQGSGIPVSERDHIFDKFTRLRGKSKAGGLGIGLAFCRLAVQGHGGRIWIESELEKGSTFHFTFPIARDEQAAGN
ncbi:MAG: ATP-binding protein, partial [Anaerolineales bacterium]|nr:ATP-binding protein [Anaerolineales bacterium]